MTLTTTGPFVADLLRGKTALITGGGTGLGFAMAQRFGALGANLVLASRSAEHVEPAAEMLREGGADALAMTFDVRDPEAVQRVVDATVEHYGRLDILVNNAAGNFLVRAERLSPNGWKAVRGIVLDGTFYCSRAAFGAMSARGGGAILNIVATYAESAGPFVVHSAASKAGVLSLTRTMAVEWARHGIRVNAIAPGPIDTAGAGGQLWESDEARAALAESVPMGRFGTLDELADTATFLVGDAASWTTGALLTVDGGVTLGNGLFDSRFATLMRDDG